MSAVETLARKCRRELFEVSAREPGWVIRRVIEADEALADKAAEEIRELAYEDYVRGVDSIALLSSRFSSMVPYGYFASDVLLLVKSYLLYRDNGLREDISRIRKLES